jgi:hypothetical protein
MERRSVNQTVALVFGAVYVLVGVIGFFVTKFADFASPTTKKLIIFQINPLHNIVHILIGLFLLGAGRVAHRAARAANLTVGAAYAVVFVLGLFIAGKTTSANFLAINQADNGLHIVSALVLIGVALGADKAYTTVRNSGSPATRL